MKRPSEPQDPPPPQGAGGLKDESESVGADLRANAAEAAHAPDAPDLTLEDHVRDLRASSLSAARALMPLTEAERLALTDKLLGPEVATREDPPQIAAPEKRAGSSPSKADARRPRTFQRWAPFALAAAFGVLALVGLFYRRGDSGVIAYDLHAEGDMGQRGDPPSSEGSPLVLRPSTRLLVVLTPRKPVRDIAVRMLLVVGGEARLLHPPHEDDGQGKITIDRPAREVLGDAPNGPAELVWVVGPKVPVDAEIERIALDPSREVPEGAAVLRRKVTLRDFGAALLIPPSDLQFTGCKGMSVGAACEVVPGTRLALWAPFEATQGKLEIDGHEADAASVPVDGGTRWTMQVKSGDHEITLSSARLSGPLRISLAPAKDAAGLIEATRLVDEGALDAAEAALDRVTDSSSSARIGVLRQRARIARRRGQPERAETLFREAAGEASRSGRTSDEIEVRHLLAFQAMSMGRDLAAAAADLSATRSLEDQCSPWKVDGDYYRGMLAAERGRYGEALSAFAFVRRSAARLDLPDLEGAVLQPLAEVLSIWGRDEEALSLFERASALAPSSPCERGLLLTNWAWAEHRAAVTPEAHGRAAARAEEALRALGGQTCGETFTTALLNTAFTQAAAGREKEARSALARVRTPSEGDARLRPWTARLEMDLDSASAPERSLSTADRIEHEIERAPSPELSFEAAFGRARALDSLDRRDEAMAAYEEAASREIRWARTAPLGEGRALFFERQRGVFRAWVDFAVRRAERTPQDPDATRAAALDVARVVTRSLGRFFATLTDAGESTSKPPLVALPPVGEAHLYYHPVERGWVAVAIGADGQAVIHRLTAAPRGSRAELSGALLRPFESVLKGARRVVVRADRALADVDFSSLVWGEGALSERASVVYGTGVPGATVETRQRGGECASRPFALVVIDPSRNLAGARRTGEEVAARFREKAKVLAGEAATRAAVLLALGDPCTTHFEVDGHAVFGTRRDGLGAGLMLADGLLSASEILDPAVIPRVPGTVILSACETAREEGLGVALAFLQRGSREVLATTARVDDARAAELVEALYARGMPSEEGEWDLGDALRGAVRSLTRAGASPDSFRVLVR